MYRLNRYVTLLTALSCVNFKSSKKQQRCTKNLLQKYFDIFIRTPFGRLNHKVPRPKTPQRPFLEVCLSVQPKYNKQNPPLQICTCKIFPPELRRCLGGLARRGWPACGEHSGTPEGSACVFRRAKYRRGTAIPSTSLGTGLAVVARASSPCPTRKTAKSVLRLNTYGSARFLRSAPSLGKHSPSEQPPNGSRTTLKNPYTLADS